MDTETLTCKVCEARADYGITQQQLADATGISVRTIISIEKGRRLPTTAMPWILTVTAFRIFGIRLMMLLLPPPTI